MRENGEGAPTWILQSPQKTCQISYIHLKKTSADRYNKQKHKKSQNKMNKNHN